MNERNPTSLAIKQCAEWLAYALSIGWSKDQIDALSELWWKHHDDNGNLTC